MTIVGREGSNSVIDFYVKAELQRIPCYKPLYDVVFFKTVKFKNRRIYWNDKFDFHLDQILERGQKNYTPFPLKNRCFCLFFEPPPPHREQMV